MQKQWFVYKYTFPNKKVYIGKTYEGSNRYGNTNAYHTQVVYKAMQKYPNYTKSILQYYNNEKDAYEGEVKYIQQYNATSPKYGYNISVGGDGGTAQLLTKQVKQYNYRGNLLKIWPSIIEAATTLKIPDCQISQNCHPDKYPEVKTAGGYQWELVNSPRKVYDLGESYNQSFSFKQYDNHGNLLKTFNNVNELKVCGFNPSCVYRVCHGQRQTYKGYYWGFADRDQPQSFKKIGRRIIQYDLTGEYICTWNSVKEAAKAYNLSGSSISHVCRGDMPQAAGFQWRYEDKNMRLNNISKIRVGNKNAKKENKTNDISRRY